MKERYPELDLNASTDRFTSHFTSKGSRHPDWTQRWKAWVSEDGSDPKRTKRTASRPTRAEQRRLDNRRRTDAALALIRAVPIDMAGGTEQD